MSTFIEQMTEKAKQNPQRVAFPETGSVDILKTAARVVEAGIGYPTLIGVPETIEALAAENGVSTTGFTYFNNTDADSVAKLAETYTASYDELSAKGVTRKCRDTVLCAMLLLKVGMVDCVAAGKEYSTEEVLLDAIQIVGLQDGVDSPSSLGIADIPGFEGPQGQYLVVSDCATTKQPDARGLAGIAISSSDTVKSLLGWEPRVAMLSFSTCGSSEHESIDVIREAIEIVHELRPDILIDGEFQLDSAIMPGVAARKVKRESAVAGRANVLVFPNLHAGNIGVKLIQIFGHANAYGPVLQGFQKPVCDFSRSAPVDEMLGNVAMLIVRAAGGK